MRLNHARDFPRYYAPILAGTRYFAFHGDGFCCFLALLFQGLVKSKLLLSIDVHYSRNADHSFSHGYCMGVYQGQEIYIDPDLKAIFPYANFPSFEPASWFYNMIENTAITLYQKVSSKDRKRLFFGFTQQYFDWLAKQGTRELSASTSRYAITHDLLHSNLPCFNEIYDITSDDYPWKALYRREVCRQRGGSDGQYLMYDIDSPAYIKIPCSGSFLINGTHEDLESIFQDLESIYFGRKAATLVWELEPAMEYHFVYPEIPWGISIVGEPESFSINSQLFNDKMTRIGSRSFLGMGDLDSLVEQLISMQPLIFKSSSRVTIEYHFPINASFWNSSLLGLSLEDSSNSRVYFSKN
jgi:hypothetical protein